MKKFLLTSFFVLIASAALAVEDNANPSPWRSETTYGAQAGQKLYFGARNLFLGWTELFTEPFEQGSPVGIVQGLGNTVMDTVGGFLHVLTAPLTQVDVPLPENGVSLFQNE